MATEESSNQDRYPTERWAVTIVDNDRRHDDEERAELYRKLLDHWTSELGVKVKYMYKETGYIRSKLHLHGTIELPEEFYRKKLCIPGFHLKLVKLYDEDTWIKYASCQGLNKRFF